MMRLKNYKRLMHIVFLLLFSACTIKEYGKAAQQPMPEALSEIREVSVTPSSFNPTKGETVKISYKLPNEARVTVKIFDPDYGLVKTLITEEHQNEGMHQYAWDGRDEDGNIIPDQAYFFTIEAQDQSGNIMIYDPTTFSGREEIDITDVQVNREANTVSFRLPRPAWVLGRIGIHGGPMLKTLLDWEPRQAGENIAYWNGKDESNIVNLEDVKGYSMMITTMAFPENSIITVGNSSLSYWQYKERLAKGREQKADRPDLPRKELVKISRHYNLSRAEDKTPIFNVSFLNISERTKEGIPILQGKVPLLITLDEMQKAFITGQRYEIALYLDYQLFAEEEEGYTPFKWIWDTQGISKGEHILTVNVISLGDQVGAGSLKFIKEGD